MPSVADNVWLSTMLVSILYGSNTVHRNPAVVIDIPSGEDQRQVCLWTDNPATVGLQPDLKGQTNWNTPDVLGVTCRLDQCPAVTVFGPETAGGQTVVPQADMRLERHILFKVETVFAPDFDTPQMGINIGLGFAPQTLDDF